jgi:predicted amidophosphoribosyltransferase
VPAGIDGCLALLSYEGVGRELVARLKYRNARAAVGPLAGAMAGLVDRAEVDVVSWAPTTPARRRERGFDQARLLARAVARRLGRPCRSLLTRSPGPAQTGRTLDARRSGPVFAPRGRVPARVLLVDDVVTSGATVSAAAAALRLAGAEAVYVLAAARTPLKAAPLTSDPAR